ncbi:MAG: TonB-dependent receptor [Xanthomonadales bacterium]|nr:TonB-dependent receptor [Xanthomonadales bacterium]
MHLHATATRTLLAVAISLACAGVSAQQASPGSPDGDAVPPPGKQNTTNLKAVVVSTGTRSFNRTEVDSLAPIDVLTPKDLKATGAPNLSMALRTLLPSINFAQPSNVDATEAVRPVQLRGLSPDEVLVLVNGKRMHSTSVLGVDSESYASGSSGVDMNSIPVNAIDHIEVLRDGAAAQYGSDAIAGVINIILKGGGDHGSVSVTHGMYSAGDGSTWQGSADGGFDLGQKGWVHMSANVQHQEPTNRAGPDVRFPGDPTYGTVTFHDGLPLSRSKAGTINFQYDLTPQAQLYGYFMFSKRNVSGHGYFRSLSAYKDDNPAAVAVYPRGYLPTENSALRDDSEVLGLRGTTIGDWHYDISANNGGNHWKLHTADTFNYSLGAASPTGFYIGTTATRDKILNADFIRDFRPGWLRNPLTVAWGLEYRDETYTLKEGDPASYFGEGAQVFPGFQPSDASSHSRQNKAAYVDLSTDLTDKLSADVAARYEHYSDFGNAKPLKLSGRYAFSDTVALRGTVATGFRAPSLVQSWYSSTSLNSFNDPVTGAQYLAAEHTFPVNNPAAIALGAQPLKAEKSRNYSLGLVLTPASGLYATVDIYQISISDRIRPSSFLTGPEVQDYLTSVGIPFVAGGAFFTNAVSTRTRGGDVVLSYPFDLGHDGTVKLTGGINYNKTDVTKIKPNPPQLGLAGLVLPVVDNSTLLLLTDSTPKTKAFVGATWDIGNWTVNGTLTRYGTFVVPGTTAISNQSFPARYVLDASASYALNRWTFTLGANDLNDAYPGKNDDNNNFAGIFVYPHRSPMGDGGAYVYATAAYSW